MSLQWAIEGVLPELRREAEGRMQSRATIRRKTGEMMQDETTGVEAPEWTVIHADVPFRLGGSDSGDSASRRQNIGGVEVQIAVRIGHLPAIDPTNPTWPDGSPRPLQLQDGDYIDVLTGEHQGSAWSVVEAQGKDQNTATRLPLLAQDRPEEWP